MPADTTAARMLVQAFYDWYTSRMESYVRNPSSGTAKSGRPIWEAMNPEHHLSSELVDGLREDSIAKKTSQGDLVGLDADPFLLSQDPCGTYTPIGTTVNGGKILVSVVVTNCPQLKGFETAQPKPVVEVTPVGAGFEISDVSGGGSSLRGTFCDFAKERGKHPEPCQ